MIFVVFVVFVVLVVFQKHRHSPVPPNSLGSAGGAARRERAGKILRMFTSTLSACKLLRLCISNLNKESAMFCRLSGLSWASGRQESGREGLQALGASDLSTKRRPGRPTLGNDLVQEMPAIRIGRRREGLQALGASEEASASDGRRRFCRRILSRQTRGRELPRAGGAFLSFQQPMFQNIRKPQ